MDPHEGHSPCWNHRIIDHGSWLGIHEVYYDKNGKPMTFTVNAVAVIVDAGEGPQALRATLEQMHSAFENPVLKPEDFQRSDLSRP